jgi:hypothetical protein
MLASTGRAGPLPKRHIFSYKAFMQSGTTGENPDASMMKLPAATTLM